MGSQLGLINRWPLSGGAQGDAMVWHAPFLFWDYSGPAPQVLVIHLGSNDLGLVKGTVLDIQVRDDFVEIKRHWPEVVLILSAMVPHRL